MSCLGLPMALKMQELLSILKLMFTPDLCQACWGPLTYHPGLTQSFHYAAARFTSNQACSTWADSGTQQSVVKGRAVDGWCQGCRRP